MRTQKQLEEWVFSTNNFDNNESLREDLEKFSEKSSNSETSSVDGLPTTCRSCNSSKNIIKSLKQRVEKLEVKQIIFC